MQNGSIIRTQRQYGSAVWEFRWREPSPDGKRKHRRMVIGSVDEVPDYAGVLLSEAPGPKPSRSALARVTQAVRALGPVPFCAHEKSVVAF
jgi:hypothetical protein